MYFFILYIKIQFGVALVGTELLHWSSSFPATKVDSSLVKTFCWFLERSGPKGAENGNTQTA
jgi:hypothetical protein